MIQQLTQSGRWHVTADEHELARWDVSGGGSSGGGSSSSSGGGGSSSSSSNRIFIMETSSFGAGLNSCT
jgi:hypothetical protein